MPERITAHDAIAYAERHADARLHKYADPTEPARPVTLAEARQIAAEDPSLIYCDTIEPEPDHRWMVEDEHGTATSAGMTSAQAQMHARHLANRNRRPYYATHPNGGTIAEYPAPDIEPEPEQ